MTVNPIKQNYEESIQKMLYAVSNSEGLFQFSLGGVSGLLFEFSGLFLKTYMKQLRAGSCQV